MRDRSVTDPLRIFEVDFEEEVETFFCDFEIGSEVSPDEYYGAYEVTPTSGEQYLRTANKSLSRDVTVHAVPYHEVSNPDGGYTATIL